MKANRTVKNPGNLGETSVKDSSKKKQNKNAHINISDFWFAFIFLSSKLVL